MSRSDGSTADYYELPEGSRELQELISHRNMNAQIGEIFRACYRYGIASHSDCLRDAKKMRFYADAEVKRLEKLAAATREPAQDIDDDSPRAMAIGQNGNTGEHYYKDFPAFANALVRHKIDGDLLWVEGYFEGARAYQYEDNLMVYSINALDEYWELIKERNAHA